METTPLAPMPEQPKSNKSTNLILMILVLVLLLGNLATLYFLFKKPAAVAPGLNTNTVITNENTNNTNNNVSTSTDEVVVSEEFIGLKPLQVTWEKPSSIVIINLVKNYDNLKKYADTLSPDSGMKFSEFIEKTKFYRVGKIQNKSNNSDGSVNYSEYDGAELFIATTPQYGPSFRPNFYRFIKYNDNLLLLDKQSDQLDYDVYMQLFINSGISNFYLANLETPDQINIPNSKDVLLKDKTELSMLLQDFDINGLAKKLFDNVYTARNCYFIVAPDGSVRVYYLKTDLWDADNDYLIAGRTNQLFHITWNDGSKNDQEYGAIAGPLGCGGPGCYDIVDYITNINMLKVAGKSPSGSLVYELKDINTKASESYKDSVLQEMYNNYYPGYDENTRKELPKISFEEYLTKHPLVFWQDPFGKFIAFTNSKYAVGAECGKPVIYLYPTKTTDVSVKVNPTGGFIKTEPVYGTGWRVLAEPNGKLYNYQDQKNYPYLFWEGYALNYTMSDQGFVVAKNEVNKFLREKLAIQGLNTQEINDFIEFWLPRMQSDPYYFVTFVPQAEFDQMAPLTVSPQPDSIIRVFMDFKALAKPIQVSEQKLSTPKRAGFTVVEWGGELQK